jgi:hypothetical protein
MMKPLSKGLTATLGLILATFTVSPEVEAGWLDKVEQYDCNVRVTTYTPYFPYREFDYKNLSLLIIFEYNYGNLSYNPIKIRFDTKEFRVKDEIYYEYNEIIAFGENKFIRFNDKTNIIISQNSIGVISNVYNGKCEKK